MRSKLAAAATSLRIGEHPLPPFHWEIEFPEVFSRENAGFEGFVGNPPFQGGLKISEHMGMPYFKCLTEFYAPAAYTCDLCAYFLRRMFHLLRLRGCLGTLATKTVSQGETRAGGLEIVCQEGGVIFNATTRLQWPGTASVIASVVHVCRGSSVDQHILNRKHVRRISAYLFPTGPDSAPMPLTANPYFSAGCNVAGQGFVFDDADGKANPLAKMHEILEVSPQSEQRIFPYIGGSELNTSPTQAPSRFVINLSDSVTEDDVKQWPDLAELVRETVKPQRDALESNPNNTRLKRKWWAYHAHRPELSARLSSMTRTLVIARVSQSFAFVFVSAKQILSEKVVVITTESWGAFASLQCRVHEVWTRFLCATLKDDLQYTASDCYVTYPMPTDWERRRDLEAAGEGYHKFRAELMVHNAEGLTKTYNRFHDPLEQSSEILHLRELHAAMDRAVLEAYGWDDLAAAARCEFLLDYEEEGEEEVRSQGSAVSKRKKKKPWRYRWPDDFRDEVLARLLELNEQRHQEELLAGPQSDATKPEKKAKTKKSAQKETLF